MDSELNIKKENDGYILTDVVNFDKKGIIGLYNTFNTTRDIKEQQLSQLSSQIKTVSEELELTNRRFDKLKKFMEAEGIIVPEKEVEETKKQD